MLFQENRGFNVGGKSLLSNANHNVWSTHNTIDTGRGAHGTPKHEEFALRDTKRTQFPSFPAIQPPSVTARPGQPSPAQGTLVFTSPPHSPAPGTSSCRGHVVLGGDRVGWSDTGTRLLGHKSHGNQSGLGENDGWLSQAPAWGPWELHPALLRRKSSVFR